MNTSISQKAEVLPIYFEWRLTNILEPMAAPEHVWKFSTSKQNKNQCAAKNTGMSF